jgi:hypothetical protein
MRRWFARSARSAAVVGVAGFLAGGGAYALAASSGKTITVCVSHKGGALYKARRCKRHDKKLRWNARGPAGPTGPQGPQGAPGGTILSYDASASASPTLTTLGTVLGDTWYAECTLSGGRATSNVLLKTSDGSWDIDSSTTQYDSASGNGSVAVTHGNAAAGSYSSPASIGPVSGGAAPDEVDDQAAITQLGPTPGSIVVHVTSDDTSSSQTCHVSIQAFPATLSSVSGPGIRSAPLTHAGVRVFKP